MEVAAQWQNRSSLSASWYASCSSGRAWLRKDARGWCLNSYSIISGVLPVSGMRVEINQRAALELVTLAKLSPHVYADGRHAERNRRPADSLDGVSSAFATRQSHIDDILLSPHLRLLV